MLNVNLNSNYRNAPSGREFLKYIASHFRMKILDQLRQQKVLGLMIDESMDVSGEKYLVVNFKTLFNREPKEVFTTLLQLEKCDAESIFAVLIQFLAKFELTQKIESVSTDGASVMIGGENGVVAKLKNFLKRPHLITIHCLSHRLNLGAKDLWENEQRVQSFNSIVFSLIRHFRQGSSNLHIPNETELENVPDLTLLRPIDIRWLYFQMRRTNLTSLSKNHPNSRKTSCRRKMFYI